MELERVRHMPSDLEPGRLYVSEEFATAAHLCPCGCGTKVRTPLGPTEWEFKDGETGPSLHPSVGNWQHACQSHYWIRNGEVMWARKWSADEIEAGRRREEARRAAYYAGLSKPGIGHRLWTHIRDWLHRS